MNDAPTPSRFSGPTRLGPQLAVSRAWPLVLAVAIGGCAGLPKIPITPADDPSFSLPQTVVPEGIDEDPPLGLTLEPGDVITVRTYSSVSQEHTGLIVDDRGMVHVPLAGPIPVGGQTLEDAEANIQAALRRFDAIVRVSIILTEPSGQRATVVGAVAEAGRATLLPGMRVADLLATVGGPMVDNTTGEVVSLADLDGSRLVRNGQTLPISVGRALEGDPRHNIRVRPGDHLYVVPIRGRHITVLGEVGTPRLIPHRDGIRLTQVLALSGGISSEGDRSDIHVVRGPLRAPRVYRASLRAIVDGKSTDVELAPGDIVYVTQEWTASTGEVLARLAPILSIGTTAVITYLIFR